MRTALDNYLISCLCSSVSARAQINAVAEKPKLWVDVKQETDTYATAIQ